MFNGYQFLQVQSSRKPPVVPGCGCVVDAQKFLQKCRVMTLMCCNKWGEVNLIAANDVFFKKKFLHSGNPLFMC